MNFKHLCAATLFCACTMNSSFAQNEIVSKAMLLISYKKTDNSKQRGQINLSGAAAYQFDVADFLSKNKYEDIQINGRATVNHEKLSWQFRSRDLNDNTDCQNFKQVVMATKKAPFLGVSVLAMEDFSGVEVVNVIEGSAAETYGFQIGDVITAVNDYEIYTPCDLTSEIGQIQPNDLLTIEIERGKEHKTIQPKLGYHLHKKLSWTPDCNQNSAVTNNVSSDNFEAANLSVYPNPTTGQAQVNYTATALNAVQLNLTDLTEKIIFSKKIEEFPGFYNDVLDLTTQPEGIYFLNIIQGDEVKTEKIVLQKR